MAKKYNDDIQDKIATSLKDRDAKRNAFSYLKMPKGVQIYNVPKKKTKVLLDFLKYEVTSQHHMDRNEKSGIATEGELWYRLPFLVHRNVGPNQETIICPTTFGGRCPICEYRVKLIKKGAGKDEYKIFFPRNRSLYVLLPIDPEPETDDIYIWDMSDKLFEDVLRQSFDEDSSNMRFSNFKNGLTATVRFKWKSLGDNDYPEAVLVEFDEREPYDMNEMLKELPSLDDMLIVLSYNEISKKFYEGDDDEEPNAITDEIETIPDEPPTRHRHVSEEPAEESAPKRKKPVEEDVPVQRRRRISAEESPKKEEEPAPRRRRQSQPEDEAPKEKKESKPKDEKEKCQFGHRFGIDTLQFDACDTCDIWKECNTEKRRLNALNN